MIKINNLESLEILEKNIRNNYGDPLYFRGEGQKYKYYCTSSIYRIEDEIEKEFYLYGESYRKSYEEFKRYYTFLLDIFIVNGYNKVNVNLLIGNRVFFEL